MADGLAALRAELDEIDGVLLGALRNRLECCARIAHYKRDHRVPMMQPHRVALVHQRATLYAEQHQIDVTFLRRIYELIIAETCRLEDVIIGDAQCSPGAGPTAGRE
jgi:chorismate mutase